MDIQYRPTPLDDKVSKQVCETILEMRWHFYNYLKYDYRDAFTDMHDFEFRHKLEVQIDSWANELTEIGMRERARILEDG